MIRTPNELLEVISSIRHLNDPALLLTSTTGEPSCTNLLYIGFRFFSLYFSPLGKRAVHVESSRGNMS